MKKGTSVIIGIVVIIAIIIGGYAIFHKSNKPNTTSSSSQTSSSGINNAVLTTRTMSGIGSYLADPNGNTLYTYNLDTMGVSKCTGSCLATWPAYQDKGATTNLPTGVSTIKRTDNGQIQYTYNGLPLYYFISDTAGKVTGNNVQSFVVARPATSSQSGSSSSSTNQSTTTPSTTNNSSTQTNSSSGSTYSY